MTVLIEDNMTKDTQFQERWKATPKEEKDEYIRATLLNEVAEYITQKAFEDFGMHQSAISMELNKLILKAKECEEK
jgi:predicted XRE-type DNA-binding protein